MKRNKITRSVHHTMQHTPMNVKRMQTSQIKLATQTQTQLGREMAAWAQARRDQQAIGFYRQIRALAAAG